MRRATILLVDDDSHVTDALQRSLRREPWDFHAAAGADEALRILAEYAIDVVVSDEQMPHMNGSVLLSQIRRRYPETVRIILSGQASLENVIRAINEGEIYRFCLKPVNSADIAMTIRQALQQKQLLSLSRRLLRKYQKRMAMLDELERLQPGITQLQLDEDGAIVDDSDEGDIEVFIAEMDAAIQGRAS